MDSLIAEIEALLSVESPYQYSLAVAHCVLIIRKHMEGKVLVPAEPSEEMTYEGELAHDNWGDFADIYKAMLQAHIAEAARTEKANAREKERHENPTHGRLEKALKTIESLQSQLSAMEKERGWISVEDRLPDEHEDVLVLVGRGVMSGLSVPFQTETSFYNGKFEIEEFNFIASPVTGWMPLLPLPPHKEEQ